MRRIAITSFSEIPALGFALIVKRWAIQNGFPWPTKEQLADQDRKENLTEMQESIHAYLRIASKKN